jgi:hypothetical protein
VNFNFGDVLTRAWQIIWKHKVLWIFGILASCGRGGGGGNGGGGNSGYDVSSGQPPDLPPQVLRWFQTIEENLTTIIVVTLAIVCIIWIVAIFLSIIGKTGLIRGTAQVEGGAQALGFGELFSGSVRYFWRMFGLSFILGLPALIFIVAVIAIVIVGAAAAGNNAETAALSFLGMLPLIIGGFCVLVPVMFVLGMIFRQAENAVVLEDMRVIPALARGWEVFRKNLGPVILMAIILGVIGFVAGLVIAIPFFVIVFPAMIAFMATGAQSTAPLIFMGACLLLYVPVAWVLQGIITAYTESAWTLTYLRLTNPQSGAPVMLEANA